MLPRDSRVCIIPSVREREPWGKNGMRKTRNTKATAQRPASILRPANHPITNSPNHPIRRVPNSLASDGVRIMKRGILKKCVTGQAVYPLSEQDGLKAQERRYTAYGKEKH